LAAAALLVYLGVMYCRLVGDFFALTPLTLPQWSRVLILAGGAYLLLRFSDFIGWLATLRRSVAGDDASTEHR